jgi:hypothetical protein
VVSGDIGGSLSRITVNGTDVGHTPDSSNGPFWVAHTGETATIVLDPGPTPGMEYSTPWVKVEMDTPHLQVDGATVGVGDEVESHVYASDHGFMPMPAGVYSLPWPEELTLTPKFTPDGIMSIDGSVTIAAGAGEAIFTLHGEAAGSTQVVMAIAEKGAASAPAQQKVMQITNGTLRPRPTAITEQLQKLDAEEFTDRQAAQAQLEEWLRQYPELREDYLRERANLKDEGKGRVDEMLSKQTLVLRLEGNKLTFERGPGAGNPGEFLQGLAKITSGPRIGLKRPGGQIEQLRVISTTGLSGSTDLAPREVGDETITVEFTVTYRDANGEPVTRPYTSTIKLKVVDEAIQEG